MIHIIQLTLLSLSLLSFSCTSVGIIVVANTDNTEITLDKRQVRDIFMRSSSQFALRPVILAPNNQARLVFNTKVVGLTESRIQSYWAQMRFAGRKKPPLEFDSLILMLNYVENNKNTITYLPNNIEIPKHLTILYEID